MKNLGFLSLALSALVLVGCERYQKASSKVTPVDPIVAADCSEEFKADLKSLTETNESAAAKVKPLLARVSESEGKDLPSGAEWEDARESLAASSTACDSFLAKHADVECTAGETLAKTADLKEPCLRLKSETKFFEALMAKAEK